MVRLSLLSAAGVSAIMTTEQMELAQSYSTHRSNKLFAEAYEHKQGTCPYGDEFIGCESSYAVNVQSTGRGEECPHTQEDRLIISHRFGASQYANFVLDAAKTFEPEEDLFDKSERMIGDESYERMLQYHIQGLMHEKIINIEDKVFMKETLKQLGVPSTTTFYGGHVGSWKREEFNEVMTELCEKGIGRFIIKPTHLAWSIGQKIVTNWQTQCKENLDAGLVELAEFIEREVLNVHPKEEDAHLTLLEPGVTIEELFNTGGHAKRPLELKVVVLWGKAYHAFVVGSDSRGCDIANGAWTMYPDGTGWNLNGVIGQKEDSEYEKVKPLLPQVFAYAETFARGIKADYARADFFVGWNEDGSPLIKMNEGELVSGSQNTYDRLNLAGMWRDGYIANGRIDVTTQKFQLLNKFTQESWERFVYHPAPCKLEETVKTQAVEMNKRKSLQRKSRSMGSVSFADDLSKLGDDSDSVSTAASDGGSLVEAARVVRAVVSAED